MSAAHQLYGGPLEGVVVMMAPATVNKYPVDLRLLRDGDIMEGTITGLGTQLIHCKDETTNEGVQ